MTMVLLANVVTMDPAGPVHADALAFEGGRITAVGSANEVRAHAGGGAEVIDLGSACVLPGFIEPHGHALAEARALSDAITDIRPMTVATGAEVMELIRAAVADAGPDGAFLNGWDGLLQTGLPEPSRALLDELSPDLPLTIGHNSGHAAYFNSAASDQVGLTRDTPDPAGASYGRDAAGELDGTAIETAAVMRVFGPILTGDVDFTALIAAETARLNAVGVTTATELGFNPQERGELVAAAQAGAVTCRLRLWEMSTPAMRSDVEPGWGDDLIRQVGIKTWADGSPWIGNIATSFPYLDTPVTRTLGLPPGHRGAMNYTREQMAAIAHAYFKDGWALSCHAHGDLAIDAVLDVWTDLLARHPRADHRLRLEHVGAMRADQCARAAELGVAVSMLIRHIYYWGDVLVDGLIGSEHGARWAPAHDAVAAGVSLSLHNDGPVTPCEPLANITTAVTRASRSGRVHGPEQAITVEQALAAHTIDAAHQLFAEDIIGSITPGKYADLTVLAEDPRTVQPADIAGIDIHAVLLAGTLVHGTLRHEPPRPRGR